MKKRLLKVLILIIIFILPYKANALILEKDNIVLLPEEEKEITLNVDLKKYYIEQVSFTLENDTNLKTTFIPSENSKDIEKNGKHTITFNEVQRGIVELGTIKTSIINTNIKSSTISFKNPIAIT